MLPGSRHSCCERLPLPGISVSLRKAAAVTLKTREKRRCVSAWRPALPPGSTLCDLGHHPLPRSLLRGRGGERRRGEEAGSTATEHTRSRAL